LQANGKCWFPLADDTAVTYPMCRPSVMGTKTVLGGNNRHFVYSTERDIKSESAHARWLRLVVDTLLVLISVRTPRSLPCPTPHSLCSLYTLLLKGILERWNQEAAKCMVRAPWHDNVAVWVPGAEVQVVGVPSSSYLYMVGGCILRQKAVCNLRA
jgi:hypothetical protein